MTEVQTAMILAAGLGTRMLPLTKDKPKPLLPLAGKPILDHQLVQLHALGIRHFVVNAHYLADHIACWLEEKQKAWPDCTFVLSDEREALLDSGGGIVKAMPLIKGNTFLVVNGDSLLDDPAAQELMRLLPGDLPPGEARLALISPGRTRGYDGKGDFCLRESARLAWPGSEDDEAKVFCGYALYTREFFAAAPEGAFSMKLLFDRGIAARTLTGRELGATFLHIGTPPALADASAFLAGPKTLDA